MVNLIAVKNAMLISVLRVITWFFIRSVLAIAISARNVIVIYSRLLPKKMKTANMVTMPKDEGDY